MARKLIIVADPGIDGAFALSLALFDPDLDLIGIAATAGNVRAEQATLNVHAIVEQLDPPRWPRIGAALPVDYEIDARHLHGPTGLGNAAFQCAKLHHPHSSDKLIADLVRQHPKEISIVALGPLTALARAIDRDPEIPALAQRIICMGGAWREPGNVNVTAEFHFYCDAPAARQVLRSGAQLLLIPLDVSRRLLLSPAELSGLLDTASRTCAMLRKIVPFGVGATSNLYGIEGFHLKDVLGIAALSVPAAFTTRPAHVDVETRGELTRGMTVIDTRAGSAVPNLELAIDVDPMLVRDYLRRVIAQAA
jgi:inosine-uridine nucleoside N-ribohydrolase